MIRLALAAVVALCTLHATSGQRCTGDTWFVLDLSETARDLSDNYRVLRDQIASYVDQTRTSRTGRLGIVSYSNNARVSQPLVSSDVFLRQLSNTIPDTSIVTRNGNTFLTAGSRTYVGLEEVNRVILSPSTARVVIISTASSPRNGAEDARFATLLRDKGVQLYGIGVRSTGGLVRVTPNTEFINSYSELLLALSRLQPCDNPDTVDDCANCQYESGKYTVEDPEFCGKFITCLGYDKATGTFRGVKRDCGPGTLFNNKHGVCEQPKDYDCPSGRGVCNAANSGLQFSHQCCTRYWRCSVENATTTVKLWDCQAGEIFNPQSRNCERSNDLTCASERACDRPIRPRDNCAGYEYDPQNQCRYYQLDAARNRISRQCAPGTAWNRTDCTCSIRTTTCDPVPVRGVNQIDRWVVDGAGNGRCEPFVDVTFGGNAARVDGQDMAVTMNNVTVVGNNAVFTGREGASQDVIFLPYYSNRDMPLRFAFELTFSISTTTTTTTEYVLLSNDRCRDCQATLRLSASVRGGSWDFTFWVQGAGTSQATVSATAFRTTNANYVVRAVVDNGRISLTVNGNRNTGGSGDTFISPVQHNDCGLSIGQGVTRAGTLVALDGQVREFKAYECSTMTNFV